MKTVFKKVLFRSLKKQNDQVKYVFIIVLVILGFVIFYSIKVPRKFFRPMYADNYRFDTRIVHLDLKGAPPKLNYFKKLFPILKSLGATGLLIEYEDMFPYNGDLIGNISALNSYSIQEIKEIIKLADWSGLEIIPLVQTFGHLEFVLKLEEFQDLREVLNYPQSICPSHPGSMKLVKAMLKQVLDLHPKSKIIHIGADEVYHLGVCNRCFKTLTEYGWSKEELFLSHMEKVVLWVKRNYPEIKVVMWDDQFRGMNAKVLKNSAISHLVEPVVWKYSTAFYDLGPNVWKIYSEIFPTIWVASAYKGATGSNQYYTDTLYHLQNHQAWSAVVAEYGRDIHFAGIMMTGWQRYDHFSILCELLPVAIPSLAVCLHFLMNYNESLTSQQMKVGETLQCQQPLSIMTSSIDSPNCLYPGGQILDLITKFHQLKQEYSTIAEDSRVRGWMNDYNVKYSFSSPHHVEVALAPLTRMRIELNQLDIDLVSAMQNIYDNSTINEFRDSYIMPLKKQLFRLFKNKEKLLSKTTWPRRPLQAT